MKKNHSSIKLTHNKILSAFKLAITALSLLVVSANFMGCDDDDSKSCSNDQACARGQICVDTSCTALPCQSIFECPGFVGTCLADLNACSAKECGDQLNGVVLERSEDSNVTRASFIAVVRVRPKHMYK